MVNWAGDSCGPCSLAHPGQGLGDIPRREPCGVRFSGVRGGSHRGRSASSPHRGWLSRLHQGTWGAGEKPRTLSTVTRRQGFGESWGLQKRSRRQGWGPTGVWEGI